MGDEMAGGPVTAETFEALRPRLFAIAYRMLGTVGEAEDIVQEALLRAHDARAEIEIPEAWLTSVTTRLAIDHLRSARVRRETYVGPWLPEPLVEDSAPARAEEAESVSMAFLVLLERLTPVERAVFLLRDVFDYSFAEIARIVERSEANVRQILVRARKAIDAERPRFEPSAPRRDELAARFLAAASDGDMDGLVELLAEDVTFYGDGGGKATATPRPLVGPALVAKFATGLFRIAQRFDIETRPALVNGQPGAVVYDTEGRVISAMSIEIADGAIVAVHSVVNPDKLGHLGPVSDFARRSR
jgi:RNA polymerase sigma-70 factor (ECF subfamily)